MKIALVMSGHMRSFRECFSSQEKYLLSVLNPDVYLHTWDETHSKTQSWHNQNGKSVSLTDEHLNDIERMYSPKTVLVEKQQICKNDSLLHATQMSLCGLRNMTYGISKSHQLMMDSGIHYDFIVRFRPDILLKSEITSEYKNLTESEVLYYGNPNPPPSNATIKKRYHSFRALDIFSFSSYTVSKYVFGTHKEFEKYYCKTEWHHSPQLDYAIDNGVVPIVSEKYLYDKCWYIKRDK